MRTRRQNQRERGAAVLIVMLAVTMLTAVGVFAAHRAAMVTSASGYDRQAQQTRYLAEYAGRITASELSDGRATEYLRLATDVNTEDTCDANSRAARPAGLPTRLPCAVITPRDLTARVTDQNLYTSLLDDVSADSSGSLAGPGGSPLEGLMKVELIDVHTIPPLPGSTDNSVEVTITTWAQVRAIAATDSTVAPSSWTGNAAYAGSTSVQALRASFLVPNVFIAPNRN